MTLVITNARTEFIGDLRNDTVPHICHQMLATFLHFFLDWKGGRVSEAGKTSAKCFLKIKLLDQVYHEVSDTPKPNLIFYLIFWLVEHFW